MHFYALMCPQATVQNMCLYVMYTVISLFALVTLVSVTKMYIFCVYICNTHIRCRKTLEAVQQQVSPEECSQAFPVLEIVGASFNPQPAPILVGIGKYKLAKQTTVMELYQCPYVDMHTSTWMHPLIRFHRRIVRDNTYILTSMYNIL